MNIYYMCGMFNCVMSQSNLLLSGCCWWRPLKPTNMIWCSCKLLMLWFFAIEISSFCHSNLNQSTFYLWFVCHKILSFVVLRDTCMWWYPDTRIWVAIISWKVKFHVDYWHVWQQKDLLFSDENICCVSLNHHLCVVWHL